MIYLKEIELIKCLRVKNDKDFQKVTNSYVNGSSTYKGNSNKLTTTLDDSRQYLAAEFIEIE